MDDFLRQCLSGIPNGKYRKRLSNELEDHLTLLAHALIKVGYSEQEAQKEALRQIGDPTLLNASYQEVWLKQPERKQHDVLRLFQGCLLAGVCYLVTFGVLGICGFGYDGNRFPIVGHSDRCAVFGSILFLSAFLAEAFFLRTVFRRRNNCAVLITAGLLMTWVAEKSIILLFSAMIYGISPFSSTQLLQRIAYGGDQTAPWFTFPYIVCTFVGCLVFGWLFGKKRAFTSTRPAA